jgi:cellulose biosynthesis protein BcsQ
MNAVMAARRIIAVVAPKGGVGKSTIALEVAAALDAVLVDLDWDPGCASVRWGAGRADKRILTALEAERAPKPRYAQGRPLLVPSHPELALGGWQPGEVADRLEAWSASWGRSIVVDTHPGIGELAYGAVEAASVVAVPVPLREMEVDAVSLMLQEYDRFPLVLVANLVPPVPPERQLRRLRRLVEEHGLLDSPAVSWHPWLARRSRRAALVLQPPSRQAERAVAEFRAVAGFLAAAHLQQRVSA